MGRTCSCNTLPHTTRTIEHTTVPHAHGVHPQGRRSSGGSALLAGPIPFLLGLQAISTQKRRARDPSSCSYWCPQASKQACACFSTLQALPVLLYRSCSSPLSARPCRPHKPHCPSPHRPMSAAQSTFASASAFQTIPSCPSTAPPTRLSRV